MRIKYTARTRYLLILFLLYSTFIPQTVFTSLEEEGEKRGEKGKKRKKKGWRTLSLAARRTLFSSLLSYHLFFQLFLTFVQFASLCNKKGKKGKGRKRGGGGGKGSFKNAIKYIFSPTSFVTLVRRKDGAERREKEKGGKKKEKNKMDRQPFSLPKFAPPHFLYTLAHSELFCRGLANKKRGRRGEKKKKRKKEKRGGKRQMRRKRTRYAHALE